MRSTLFVWVLLLFAGWTTALSDPFISSIALRQAGPNSSIADCNATCTNFQELQAKCTAPHCGCNVPFLRAQGECLLCQTRTSEDAANAQILLDVEIAQCHSENFKVDFQLELPPEAEKIYQKFRRDSASLRTTQTAFLGLQIAGGHIGLVLVLLSAVFSHRSRRDAPFLNFCLTWIFSSIAFSMLLYRGTDNNNVANTLGNVSPIKCSAQAALTEGAQVMTAASTLALVVQLWNCLRKTVYEHCVKQATWVTCMLVVTPYILFIIFSLPPGFVGTDHIVIENTSINKAMPTNFYCVVAGFKPFLQAVYGVTLSILIITVVFDVLIVSILYRHWRSFRRAQAKSAVPLSVLLRVIIFSIYRVVVAVAYATVLNMPPRLSASVGISQSLAFTFNVPVWVDILQAATPLVGFMVLCINRDMIDVVFFWWRFLSRNASKPEPTNVANPSVIDDRWNEKAVVEELPNP